MKRYRFHKLFVVASFAVAIFSFSFSLHARYPSNSAVYFRPSLDGSKYLSTEQSQGLYQWGYNFGLHANYAHEPAEVVPSTGGGRQAGVIDDLLVVHFTTSLGLMDWLNIGVDVPVVAYETFFNFINPDASQCNLTTACPKQTKTKMGDILFGTKIRLLDSDRHAVGLSLQPFVMFPTGSGYYTTGYGRFTWGGKLIFDANINEKVFVAINAGYHDFTKQTRYSPDTAFATIDDQLLLNAAANVPIGKNFAAIAEIFGETLAKSPFKHQIQSPFEVLGGVRYSPGTIKRWAFTLAGGTGITKGYGAAGYRAMVQVNYRKTKVVEVPGEAPPVSVEAPFEEKIIITQRIHFEFDKSVIRPISFPILDDVVEVLKRNPQIRKVQVEGHTDWIGSDAYNMKLSQRRADSVRTYLIQKGIEPDRLIAIGYGESRPVADNNTTEGRAKNRRTEFTVVDNQ